MSVKVLMFGWELPPHNSGGLGVACQGLLRSLVDEGVEVIFVMPRTIEADDTGAKLVFADDGRVAIRYVDAHLLPYTRSADGVVVGPGGGTQLLHEARRYAQAARTIAQTEDFDVIHAHDWLSFGAGLAAKEESGKPFVAHVHATQFDHNGGDFGDARLHKIEAEGLQGADQVITVSEFTKNMVVQKYQVNPEKVEVVHNGADISESADEEISINVDGLKKDGAKIVLFVGRITLQKGPDYFIKAARKVLEYEPNTYFVVAGSGDMERRMIEMAADMGIGDRVLFAGFTRGEATRALYKAADLFVMPSVSEPFGLVPLEAMNMNTPTLISRQSGVSEVIKHTLKVDFWDTDEMANKIISVLQHGALGRTLIENGAREVLEVNWNKAAKKVQKVYQKIMKFFKGRKDEDGA